MTRISLLAATLVLLSLTAIPRLADAKDFNFPAGPGFQGPAQPITTPLLELKNPFNVKSGPTFASPPAKSLHTLLIPLRLPHPGLMPIQRMKIPQGAKFTIVLVPIPHEDFK